MHTCHLQAENEKVVKDDAEAQMSAARSATAQALTLTLTPVVILTLILNWTLQKLGSHHTQVMPVPDLAIGDKFLHPVSPQHGTV